MDKQYPVIYIEWIDAHGNTSWFSNEEIEGWIKEDWYTQTVGFLIKETQKMIILAERHEPEKSANRTEQWGGVHKIPKTWIRVRHIIGYIDRSGEWKRMR
jgi:hypothetical protein